MCIRDRFSAEYRLSRKNMVSWYTVFGVEYRFSRKQHDVMHMDLVKSVVCLEILWYHVMYWI